MTLTQNLLTAFGFIIAFCVVYSYYRKLQKREEAAAQSQDPVARLNRTMEGINKSIIAASNSSELNAVEIDIHDFCIRHREIIDADELDRWFLNADRAITLKRNLLAKKLG